MKRQRFSFLSGMLTMALLGSLTFSALAATGTFTITADPINIQVNGTTFAPKDAKGNDVPVFAYNGTTYAPVRALAEAYGLEVGYDAKANMATVKSTSTAPTSNDKIKYYDNTSVPMVENILDIEYAKTFTTGSSTGYYYSIKDLLVADPDSNLFWFYANLLGTFGYTYLGSSEDNVLMYNNADDGNQTVALGITEDNGIKYVSIIILPKKSTP